MLRGVCRRLSNANELGWPVHLLLSAHNQSQHKPKEQQKTQIKPALKIDVQPLRRYSMHEKLDLQLATSAMEYGRPLALACTSSKSHHLKTRWESIDSHLSCHLSQNLCYLAKLCHQTAAIMLTASTHASRS